jgi:hypothetical protein
MTMNEKVLGRALTHAAEPGVVRFCAFIDHPCNRTFDTKSGLVAKPSNRVVASSGLFVVSDLTEIHLGLKERTLLACSAVGALRLRRFACRRGKRLRE